MSEEEIIAFSKSYKTDWTNVNIDYASILNHNNSSNISIEKAYQLLDLDKDGVISAYELQNRLNKIMYNENDFYDDAPIIIKAFSMDGSNEINFKDFKNLCERI